MSNLEKCKELNKKHIKLLKKEGLDPKEFLLKETSAYDYVFYHIPTGRDHIIRR